jgi:Fic family protein
LNRITGKFTVLETLGETVKSFSPLPLPPKDPNLTLSAAAHALLAKADLATKELQILQSVIPSIERFVYSFLRKEALLSSQIEGTHATLADVFGLENLGEVETNADLEKVCNYLNAFQFAREQANSPNGLPISMRLLNEAHKLLMSGTRGSTKLLGEIRTSQNWIGGTRPGNALYEPPHPSMLSKLLSELEKFIHGHSDLHSLVKIALVHAQFETIHPYLDGNGRIGRLLTVMLLQHWKILDEPLLYLSLYLKRNQKEYYQHLTAIRVEGDWESWVHFFLNGIVQISEEAKNCALRLNKLISTDREKILKFNTTSVQALRLFELLPTSPIFTTSKAVSLLNSTKPTTAKAIEVLMSVGILTEESGRKRDRVFRYNSYVSILSEGT